MSSYLSGSTPTVSGYDTQEPRPLSAKAFGNAFQPTVREVYEKCDRVVINADTGSCFLLYNTTASIGSVLNAADGVGEVTKFTKQIAGTQEKGGKIFTFATGSVLGLHVKAGEAQTLDLHVGAQAFSGSDGFDSTNITFIYRGGM